MANETQTKPSYLGLLNNLSEGEANAGIYLKAWADVTADPDIQATLACVAEREATHGAVFRQRIERLGFALKSTKQADLAEKVAFYGDANVSDIKKTRSLFSGRAAPPDGTPDPAFAELEEKIADPSVDQLTRDTLRWYVAEERDSVTMLRACVREVEGRSGSVIDGASADAQAVMACMTQGFQNLQTCMVQLAEGGSAAAPSGNGSSGVPSADAKAIMECMTIGFSGLQKSIEEMGAKAKSTR